MIAGLWGGGVPVPAVVAPTRDVPDPAPSPAAAAAAAGAAAAAAAQASSAAAAAAAAGSESAGAAALVVVVPPPAESPISQRELHARVSPAVVALVLSGGTTTPSVASGVLVTASGLVLTSRRAVADVVEGRAGVNIIRSGGRGRANARDLAEAIPARVRAVSEDLDLALLEAMPAGTVFYPHLPIARRRTADGTSALAVGHAKERGLWSGTLVPLGPAAGSKGAERWLRQLPVDGSLVGAGAPLVDGVGRIVALAVEPAGAGAVEARVAVDAEGLMRFLLAANAPELRFAGVPPARRPAPGEGAAHAARATHAKRAAGAGGPGVAAAGGTAAAAAAAADRLDAELPGVVGKGVLDRRFSRTPTSTAGGGEPALPAAGSREVPGSGGKVTGARGKGLPVVAFTDGADAVSITLTNLERHAPPATLRVDTSDAPERGARGALVTIVEIGDYHAPETRDVEPALHALTDGGAAAARLLWKDADRGDGAEYHLPARAARAAAEQDGFWPMHDRLLRQGAAQSLDLNRVRKLARELELDADEFAASMSSEGLASSIETDAIRAGRLPLLCTPAFVVNGQAVDGGSIAAAALRAAVDDELINAARKQGTVTARSPRAISAGAPILGASYDADKLARVVADATARRSSRVKPGARSATALRTP